MTKSGNIGYSEGMDISLIYLARLDQARRAVDNSGSRKLSKPRPKIR